MGYPQIATYVLLALMAYAVFAATDMTSRWLRARATPRRASAPSRRRRPSSLRLGLQFLHMLLLFAVSLLWAVGAVRASKELHHSTVQRLLFAPLGWYIATPSGRILSRYTADIGVVDTQIALYVDNAVQMTLLCVVMIVLVMVVAPMLVPFGVVALLCYFVVLVMTDASSREVKRITNNAVSLMLSTSASLLKPTIRVLQLTKSASSHGASRAPPRRGGPQLDEPHALRVVVPPHGRGRLPLRFGGHLCRLRHARRAPAEAGALMMTYAYVAPFFVSAAFQMVTQARAHISSSSGCSSTCSCRRAAKAARRHRSAARRVASRRRAVVCRRLGGLSAGTAALSLRLLCELRAHERSAVVGRTGAGKSTSCSRSSVDAVHGRDQDRRARDLGGGARARASASRSSRGPGASQG